MEHSFSVVGYNPSKKGHHLVWGTGQMHNTSVGWDITWVCHVWGRFISLHIKEILQQVLIKTVLVVIAGGHLPGKICEYPSFLICSVSFISYLSCGILIHKYLSMGPCLSIQCCYEFLHNAYLLDVLWSFRYGKWIKVNYSLQISSVIERGKVTWMWHPMGWSPSQRKPHWWWNGQCGGLDCSWVWIWALLKSNQRQKLVFIASHLSLHH